MTIKRIANALAVLNSAFEEMNLETPTLVLQKPDDLFALKHEMTPDMLNFSDLKREEFRISGIKIEVAPPLLLRPKAR